MTDPKPHCHVCNPHPLQGEAHEAIDRGDYERARTLIRQLEQEGEEGTVVFLETLLMFLEGGP